MELIDILDGIHHIPHESAYRLIDMTERISVDKNKIIISAGHVCRDVYFVSEGIVRAYSYAKERDITFWIGAEGSVALSMQSYIDDRPGYESIVTLEKCILYRIPTNDLHDLYSTDIHLANWGRKFAEKEILRAEKNLIPQLFSTGRERYEALLHNQPERLRRIPLENLASYLGLTPVSLSRIRNNIFK